MNTCKVQMKHVLDLPRDPPTKIMLKTEKGKFLSRSTFGSNENVILAYNDEVCEDCKFSLEVFPLKQAKTRATKML